MMAENSELLSPREVAKLLGVHPQTLWAWRREQKHLPFIRVGRGYVRYRREDVEALLQEKTVVPDPGDAGENR